MVTRGEAHSEKTLTLGELAELVGAELQGAADIRVSGVAALEEAQPDQISFVSHPRYASLAATSRAAALIVDASWKERGRPILLCGNPQLVFAKTAQLFAKPLKLPGGVH